MPRFLFLLALPFFVMVPVFAQDPPEILFEPIFDGVDFSSPIEVGFAPGEEGRLYVVEQGGRIQTWQEGTGDPTVFLDITDRVTPGGERGLLGLAFPPDYEESGEFYVNYTTTTDDTLRTHVSRFVRSSLDPPEADSLSEDTLLVVTQPFGNHNAGKLAFGPDGYLYIALGDGGSAGDPGNRAQDLTEHLGKLLRIDVTSEPGGGETYVIPPDNPFYNNPDYPNAQPEIYAYGLRNPWRFSFDSETGALWAGDVGQNEWEEIDIVESGGNYGWSEMEGPDCYPSDSGCDPELYELPVYWYDRGFGEDQGYTVIGGVVYRGEAIPELVGSYLFADYVNPRFWMLEEDGGGGYNSVLLSSELGNIVSINEQPSDHEVFVSTLSGGVYQLIPANDSGGAGSPSSFLFELVGPNPVRDGTRVRVQPEEASEVSLRVVDVRGREMSTVFSGTLGSGEDREFAIDTRELPAGAYFVVLDHPSERRTKRFVVVK